MSIPGLFKPTTKTKFHVDFDWWKDQDRNWRNTLMAYLCEEHHQKFASFINEENIDLVDPNTAEVTQGDAVLNTLIDHCSHQEGFISASAPLVDSIFKLFLSNGNTPLDSNELAETLGKPAATILSTISSGRVYKGIRPL